MSMCEPLAKACKQWQALKCFPAKQIKAAVYGTCRSSWLDKISHHLFNQSLSWLAHSRSHTWTGYINLFRILICSFDVRCMLKTITLEKLPWDSIHIYFLNLWVPSLNSSTFSKNIMQFSLPPPYTMLTRWNCEPCWHSGKQLCLWSGRGLGHVWLEQSPTNANLPKHFCHDWGNYFD